MRRRAREEDTGDVRPDVAGAREQLDRIKRQRPDVDALVEALIREKRLNSFTANATAMFRGGH